MFIAALRPFLLVPALCGALTLASCAPATQSAAGQSSFNQSSSDQSSDSGDLTPRPAGSPDVLLLAVSGRCPVACQAPGDNIDYLTPRGTVQAVADTLSARGLTVESYAVAANLSEHTPRTIMQAQVGAGKTVPAQQQGFLQLEARLNAAYNGWIHGRSNPTRIVLLAHSHGVVWTHALARAHPEVPIAAMIDLDGVCDLWETDNRAAVRTYIGQLGHSPWAFDLADSCGSVRVGHIRYDLKDVVFPNVQWGLEVQSARLLSSSNGNVMANLPFDSLENVRLDGTRQGLQTYRSAGETHSMVSRPESQAMAWVKVQLTALSAAWTPTPAPPTADR
ncbi:hypothetical protein [Deinococcus sp.]|uniref:hypothetical protein n=1 Tax=Deinococcus sp. TaxID=47478 RepID=UPI003C7B8F14